MIFRSHPCPDPSAKQDVHGGFVDFYVPKLLSYESPDCRNNEIKKPTIF